MGRAFYVDERPRGGFLVKFYPTAPTSGSFAVMGARALNVPFADYLRLCRDAFGARIIGKKSKYPIAIFSTKESAMKLCNLLNELSEGRIE